MVPSKTTTQRVSLWSRMCLFAVVLFLVPTAFTVAQDYDAVIKRLKQAVDAKEISPEQAKAMIAILKKSSASKPAVKKDISKTKLDWDTIQKKIEGAVKAGKLTREQADAKYTALKKQTAQKPAVKKVQGNAKPKPAAPAKPAIKKDVSKAKLDWDAIQKKIEGAVKAGTLTREQADAKYQALKKQTSQKPAVKKVESKPKPAAPAKPAVKKVESKPKPAAPAKPAVKKDVSKAKLDWDAIQKKIEGAVKAGTLTREQADAKYQALKKQTSQKPAVKKVEGKPKPATPAKPAAKKKPQ